MSGGPRHNCRGPPRSCWSWCIKPRTASVRGRQKPHPQVGVTSGCEPSWPHAVQVDTRPGGFCYLTARLPMICMVVVPFSPTIHQSHREAFQHLVELWRSAYHADRHHPGCIDVPAPAWDKPPETSTVPARRVVPRGWTSSSLNCKKFQYVDTMEEGPESSHKLPSLNVRWERTIRLCCPSDDGLPVWVQ